MKTAIYIEDGTVQLVITPESDFEKDSMKIFGEKPLKAKLFVGSFYDCRGGWVSQNSFNPYSANYGSAEDRSLIITIKEEKK